MSKIICHTQVQWSLCWTALTVNVIDVCYGIVLCFINKKKTTCKSPFFFNLLSNHWENNILIISYIMMGILTINF